MYTSGWKGDIQPLPSKQFFTKSLAWSKNQLEFPSCLIDFNPRTYFVRPKTCYCQQQSSQYPIFPSQARDQSFTRVARNETKYQKILDAADFARRENCSFIRLNDAYRKTLLKAAKKTLRKHTIKAEFSLIHVLISNWHTERIMGSYEKHFFFFGWGRGRG